MRALTVALFLLAFLSSIQFGHAEESDLPDRYKKGWHLRKYDSTCTFYNLTDVQNYVQHCTYNSVRPNSCGNLATQNINQTTSGAYSVQLFISRTPHHPSCLYVTERNNQIVGTSLISCGLNSIPYSMSYPLEEGTCGSSGNYHSW
eukprot:gb/GECG01011713.1/.p1 GENE.gb/GECG01011713.1/~~gb/GECG01011713.1/.p1  ORF type:complete len:146 (+),score=4.32 gb/GECG01011713.1/:1-438(+)